MCIYHNKSSCILTSIVVAFIEYSWNVCNASFVKRSTDHYILSYAKSQIFQLHKNKIEI